MNTYIGTSLTAAGVVFNIDDFRDPKLDQLTPIQVTKDGRVFGHLAGWNTKHIGYRPEQNVRPPRTRTDYKYFHQSVVPTTDGDLPVGHLTLGTGHAGQGDAVAAAAHYDNTGSQIASVRAGEDAHGIWIAGRVHPGTDDMARQTLRRSSLSGDWRKIDGNLELVAALAVNVPGFPIPRTEQLVASGGEPTMLVAAGIVRNGPISRAEVEAMMTAAADDAQKRVEIALTSREVKARGRKAVEAIRAHQRTQRRDSLVASGQQLIANRRREQANERFTALLAAGVESAVNDATGHMPAQLHRYWTSGAGLARWAPTPTPYRSLVKALTQEIHDMTPEQIKGLAANLYHDVFHQWPGRQNKGGGKLAASLMPPTPDEARALVADMAGLLADQPIPDDAPADTDAEVDEQFDDEPAEPVHTGGMIALLPAEAPQLAVEGGEPAAELHLTLAFLGEDLTDTMPEWRAGVVSSAVRALEGTEPVVGGSLFGRAEFNPNSEDREQCAVWLVDSHALPEIREKLLYALGDRVPPSDFGAWVPHITAGYGMPADQLPTGLNVTFDRLRIAIAGEVTDVPLGQIEADVLIGEVPGDGPVDPMQTSVAVEVPDDEPIEAAGGKRRAATQEGADKYGVSIGDVIGGKVDEAVDSANDTAQAVQRDVSNVAKAVGEAIFGKRKSTPAVDGAKADPNVKSAKPVENKAGKGASSDAGKLTSKSRDAAKSSTTAKAAPAATAKAGEAAPAKAAKSSTVTGPPKIPADAPAPRKDVGAGTDHPMEEDESPDKGALGGKLISYGDGRADYDDGSWTDGKGWHVGDPPKGTAEAPATREAKPADKAGADSPDFTVESKVPARKAGDPADRLEEDQAPDTGGEGGKLVAFENGVAKYDDGTETNGVTWMRSPVLPGMGYDGKTMLEDQSPLKGAEGGKLVSFGDGVAVYDDGTETDGKQWRRSKAAA
ncbi:RNA ligase [Gordonia phage Kwekel]|uniref:RNA ligase n=1 Tax=Gordonia phage Kwekel TaxID=3077820 RepID=A0AA96KMX6_9CAUD|nr:RNA ligase [Gordonia phage Kwekel]